MGVFITCALVCITCYISVGRRTTTVNPCITKLYYILQVVDNPCMVLHPLHYHKLYIVGAYTDNMVHVEI